MSPKTESGFLKNLTASSVASLDPLARGKFLGSLTLEQARALKYLWKFWARPNQLPPPEPWHQWFVCAGRGFGKTRTGAETIKQWIAEGYRRFALVAATPADARDVMMEGESGLLSDAVYPEEERPIYQSSKRRLVWPGPDGAVATVYSAHKQEDKSGLRGPQHEKAWGDEPGKWQYPGNLDQLLFGLRIGDNPQVILTGTPNSTPLIRELVKRSKDPSAGIVVTTGTSYENMANLADLFINTIIKKFEGTRLGKQELLAVLLEDVVGALWNRQIIDKMYVYDAPAMQRKVVAIDPGVSDGQSETACETGIVVEGLGEDDHGYLLEDCSDRLHPSDWAKVAVAAFHRHEADLIVAEANNGGEMVRLTIQSLPGCKNIPVKLVHASRGKLTRAEPVSLLSEQKRIHHLGVFADLEDQLCTWVPGEKSPDRLDAYVWGFTELMVGRAGFDISGGGQPAPEETAPVEVGTNGHTQIVDPVVLQAIQDLGGFGFRS